MRKLKSESIQGLDASARGLIVTIRPGSRLLAPHKLSYHSTANIVKTVRPHKISRLVLRIDWLKTVVRLRVLVGSHQAAPALRHDQRYEDVPLYRLHAATRTVRIVDEWFRGITL